MRIAINGMFWAEPHVGSGQYLHNLIQQYAVMDSRDKFVLVIPRFRQVQKPRLRGIQSVMMPTPFDHSNTNLAKAWFEQIALLQVAHKIRAEVLHVPYFGPPLRTNIPTAVSVLDLIPVLLPPYKGGRLVQGYMRLATAGCKRARSIIAISQHTKQDVIDHLGIPAERVAVTYLAAGPPYQPQAPELVLAVRERFCIQGPYIYYIGGFDVRKNVALLIRAFAALLQHHPQPIQLVLAGRPVGSDPVLFPDIHQVILDTGVAANVLLVGSVTEVENAALMTGCSVFVAPSRYEGFGLSPLYAMACGAPVIAAASTSVGEVVADGGRLVDPTDQAAWTTALGEVTSDEAYGQRLRQAGLERARAFNWRTTAEQTVAVYHGMV